MFCSPWFGDQTDGTVDGNLTANDPAWAASGSKSPWLGGCTYVYLKIEYDQTQFPGLPEIKFTVNGKNDIYDPRTSTSGFSQNWALCVADAITDSTWGLNDNTVNQAQLIAAANVCDEQVTLAAGGTESRYVLNWHYDTSLAPGDVISQMMGNAAGRMSRIGGEWFIWPAYWQGPSFSMDDSLLIDSISWNPDKTQQLCNRVTGTYVAANYPYNVAGNLYDSNGYYNGMTANNFPVCLPADELPYVCRGYPAWLLIDQFLAQDGGVRLPKKSPCKHACLLHRPNAWPRSICSVIGSKGKAHSSATSPRTSYSRLMSFTTHRRLWVGPTSYSKYRGKVPDTGSSFHRRQARHLPR